MNPAFIEDRRDGCMSTMAAVTAAFPCCSFTATAAISRSGARSSITCVRRAAPLRSTCAAWVSPIFAQRRLLRERDGRRCRSVTNALKLQRFVIVASLVRRQRGGRVCARHPDRVAGVVFADSAGNVKIDPVQAKAFLDRSDRIEMPWCRNGFAPILKPSRE